MQRRIALLAILLAALPAANAALQNFSLTYMDAPNNRVQPGVDQPTGVTFTIDEPELTSTDASLDLRNLQSPPNNAYSDVNVDLASCETSGATFTCTLTHQGIYNDGTNLLINHDNDTTATFNITVTTVNGDKTLTATQTITTDATPPKPTYVGPTKCQGQTQCIIGPVPTNITASFQDGTGPFQQQDVIAINEHSDGDQIIRFADTNECSDSTCQTTETIQCQNGETTTFTLNTESNPYPPTQDDAGNTIENNTETQATCDAEAPTIHDTTIQGANNQVPTVGSGATLTVNASDNLGTELTVTAAFNGSRTETTCQQGNSCDIQPPTPATPGQYDLTITVTDKAGNTASTTRTARFREQRSNQSNIWRGTTTNVLSSAVNKDILEANPTVYAKTTFQGNQADVSLNDVNLQSCNVSQSGVQSVEIDHVSDDQNAAYFTFTLRQPSGFNDTVDAQSFEANCQLNVIGTTEEYVYTAGEPENITLTVPLEDGTRLSQKLQDEIQSTRDDIQEWEDEWATAGRAIEVSQKICRVGSIVEGLWGTVSGTGEALSHAQLTKPAAETLKGIEDKGRDASSGIWRVTNSKFCQFMSCQTPFQKNVVDWFNRLNQDVMSQMNIDEETTGVGALQGLSGRRMDNAYTPYRSAAVGAVSVCLPAMRKHLRTWQAIDCKYLECLSNSKQRTGFSVSRCMAQKDRSQCMFLGKHLWNSLPLTNILSQQLSQVTKLINDPVAAGVTLTSGLLCPSMTSDSTFYFLCETGSTIQKYRDYYEDFRRVAEAKQVYENLRKSPAGLCEDVMVATRDDSEYYNRMNQPGVLTPEEAAESVDLSGASTSDSDQGSTDGQNTDETPTDSNGNDRTNTGDDQTRFGEDNQYREDRAYEESSGQGIASAPEDPARGDDVLHFGREEHRAYETRSGKGAAATDVGTGSEESTDESDQEPSSDETTADDTSDQTSTTEVEYTGTGQVVVKKTVPTEEEDERTYTIRPDGTIMNPDGFSITDVRAEQLGLTGAGDQADRVNDKLFANDLNRQPGPSVSVEEAAEIRDDMGENNVQTLQRADAYRAVADRMKEGDSIADVEIPSKNGETISGKEFLKENTDLSDDEIEELSKEDLKQRIKEDLDGALTNLTAARYNATPWEMSAWNAGSLGRAFLESRAHGFSLWDDWSEAGLGFMEDVASVSETFAAPQKKFCGQVDAVRGEFSGDVGVTTVNKTPSIGALVAGTRSDFQTPSGTTNSSYVIGYKAVTNQGGLSFTITLRGEETRDVTEEVAGSGPIEATQQRQGTYKAQGRQGFNLAGQYNQVCMEFTTNPSQYFRRATFDDNTLCQRLKR